MESAELTAFQELQVLQIVQLIDCLLEQCWSFSPNTSVCKRTEINWKAWREALELEHYNPFITASLVAVNIAWIAVSQLALNLLGKHNACRTCWMVRKRLRNDLNARFDSNSFDKLSQRVRDEIELGANSFQNWKFEFYANAVGDLHNRWEDTNKR